VIAESRQIGKIEQLMGPIRDMFSAVFFVAVGLMIDPGMLARYLWPIVIITLVVVAGKVLTCSFGTFVAGHDRRTSLRVGMGLAQIGEFSFIIASLGVALKVTSDFLYPVTVAVSVITTLLTPYLIKSSDVVVVWLQRHTPASIGASFDIYTRWVRQIGNRQANQIPLRMTRKWAWQIGLNVALTGGIFIAAVFLRQNQPPWFTGLGIPARALDAVIWAAALVASMPLLIASYRKLQALGMLLGEVAAKNIEDPGARQTIAGVVSTSILISGSVGLGLILLLLSAAILPSREILLAVLLVVALVTALLWRSFVRIYSKAQVSIRQTLSESPGKPEMDATPPLTGLLEHAGLKPITIRPDSAAVGRLIRELRLRTETGATIIGIERDGTTTVHPDPDEELLSGDRLLLLGRPEQLEKAQSVLTGPPVV
jgi:CPA2 family monovalent cation:H+ antiporter-2